MTNGTFEVREDRGRWEVYFVPTCLNIYVDSLEPIAIYKSESKAHLVKRMLQDALDNMEGE